jgi:hypothetical protein
MLLTHDAFYRTEGVPAQREIELGPAENRLWSHKSDCKEYSGLDRRNRACDLIPS